MLAGWSLARIARAIAAWTIVRRTGRQLAHCRPPSTDHLFHVQGWKLDEATLLPIPAFSKKPLTVLALMCTAPSLTCGRAVCSQGLHVIYLAITSATAFRSFARAHSTSPTDSASVWKCTISTCVYAQSCCHLATICCTLQGLAKARLCSDGGSWQVASM